MSDGAARPPISRPEKWLGGICTAARRPMGFPAGGRPRPACILSSLRAAGCGEGTGQFSSSAAGGRPGANYHKGAAAGVPRFRRFLAAMPSLRVVPASVLALVFTGLAIAAAEPAPDFEREIQPILAEHCSTCHGVDGASRQAGLRLDTRDGALAGGDSGPTAVLPGKGAESLVIHRIRLTDPAAVMPPPETQKPLSKAQRRTLNGGSMPGLPTPPTGRL